MNGTLIKKIKNLCTRLFKRDIKKKVITLENEMDHPRTKNVPNFEDRFSTRDRTPLSKNTLTTIALFKNGPPNENTPQNGVFFPSKVPLLKKLSRYQLFINFLIEHTNGNRLPSVQFIVENCMFENELVFTNKIIKTHKVEALECGDLVKDQKTNRLYLARTKKYDGE